jgi:hypothetical protein
MTEQLPASVYAARLEVDYPDEHDRVTTLFRGFLIIPIGIVIGLLTMGASQTVYKQSGQVVRNSSGGIASGLFLAALLMIVFRRRYPRWWFDFALELVRFGTRIGAYVALLTDQYPSTVDEQRIHLQIDYPNVERDLNQMVAAGEVAARDPAPRCPGSVVGGRLPRRGHRMVRDPVHRVLWAGWRQPVASTRAQPCGRCGAFPAPRQRRHGVARLSCGRFARVRGDSCAP